ncbi:hypothetical protein [Haloglomus halophilum]|uniref:hypothetical protein n=1 Tax=Haloglomus halophilum TaxID=2962672 RepID=UPI0020C99E0F|nr:hypothetical protein [Haloglomus halophilum]
MPEDDDSISYLGLFRAALGAGVPAGEETNEATRETAKQFSASTAKRLSKLAAVAGPLLAFGQFVAQQGGVIPAVLAIIRRWFVNVIIGGGLWLAGAIAAPFILLGNELFELAVAGVEGAQPLLAGTLSTIGGFYAGLAGAFAPLGPFAPVVAAGVTAAAAGGVVVGLSLLVDRALPGAGGLLR